MLRVRPTGVRARRHPGQSKLSHQALHPLAINAVAFLLEEDHHLAAAVERPPGIFLVNQSAEQQIVFVVSPGFALCIDRGTRYADQRALPGNSHPIPAVDPPVPDHGRLIPDFF